MRSSLSTRFKLGLFTLAAVGAVVAVGVGLGLQTLRHDYVAYHTYFDESVQGLDIGSIVKYRGVPIGHVSQIDIAPDRKHVDVALALEAPDAERLGLGESLPELRAQLGTQGVTGVKFVEIDFFDPAANPPPALTFQPAERYIPARRSLMKGLEGSLETLANRLPALADRATSTLGKFELLLDDVRDRKLPARVATALERAGSAMTELRTLVRDVDRARIPDRAVATIDKVNTTVAKLDDVLERIGGERGLVTSAQRATDSFAEVGNSTVRSTTELDRTLRDLDEAAQAIRDLVEEISRDPDMLVKGRARTNKR